MATVLDEVAGIIPPAQDDIPKQTAAPTPGRGRGRPRKTPISDTGSLKKAADDVPMPKAGAIADAMSQMYAFGAMGLMPFRPQTAATMMGSADACGKAWEQAAAADPRIRAMLLSLTRTSVYGVLVAAHLPIITAAMAEGREIKAAKAAALEAQPPTYEPQVVEEPGSGRRRAPEPTEEPPIPVRQPPRNGAL